MKKVSLKDVALKAGVSTALVSYVLNDKMKGRISKESIEKVQKAAEELDYRPNHIAQSLKRQKTSSIGLILSDIANPFSSYIARIIEDEAQKRGFTLIIGSSDENALKSQRLIDLFVNRQVEGIIISPVENTAEQIKELKKTHIPFVLLDRYFPELSTDNIGLDNYKASCMATEHLLSIGRKRIGIIAYESSLYHLGERIRGYEETLKKNSIPIIDGLIAQVSIDSINEDVEKAISNFLSEGIQADAILFTSNKLAVAGLKVLMERGIKIPDQLSIVSFDETDAFDLFYAPLTYIRQPLALMGISAMKVLLNKINSIPPEPVSTLFDAELVIRQSSITH